MQGRTPSLLITVSGKLERWASSGDEKSNMEKGDSDSDEMEGLHRAERGYSGGMEEDGKVLCCLTHCWTL